MTQPIYLDYNATAPLRPAINNALGELALKPLNASAVHGLGREGRRLVEDARQRVAGLLDADPANVIFNSGATEANNTVLNHFSGRGIAVSSTEHASVYEYDCGQTYIPCDENGVVDLAALEGILKERKPELVSVMLVNNETGIIQPAAEISGLAKKYGAFFHCDAVQAAGRLPLKMIDIGADFVTISSHKIGGPQGVGALVLGMCGETPCLLQGGGQEKKARAGTENVAGITGFGMAAQAAKAQLSDFQKLGAARDKLENALKALVPGIKIYGEKADRVANTTLAGIPGARSETMMMALDLEGVCVSNGSACTSGKVEPSHVLKAMGASDEEAGSALRISTGWATKDEDITRFLEIFARVGQRMGFVDKNRAASLAS